MEPSSFVWRRGERAAGESTWRAQNAMTTRRARGVRGHTGTGDGHSRVAGHLLVKGYDLTRARAAALPQADREPTVAFDARS